MLLRAKEEKESDSGDAELGPTMGSQGVVKAIFGVAGVLLHFN